MNKLILILCIALSVLSCVETNNKYKIGQQSVSYYDSIRNRPIVAEIWYPTLDDYISKDFQENEKSIFKTIQTIPNATMINSKFPLLLVSHGTGGNRFSLTWLIESMVKEGYVVVSLDHYGNTTFNKIPREFVKWWERAIDIKYVLSQLLENEEFSSRIDSSGIGAIGYSLGGYTAIALAGGYVDRDSPKMDNIGLPPEFPASEEDIDLENDSLILKSYLTYKDQVKDDRIKAFFTMAPAIGFGFHSDYQVETISAPLYIVAGKGDTNTPIDENALVYHNLIKSSEIYLFDEYVDHYVFLNEATEFGKKVATSICVDHPKVDRSKIHQVITKLAIDFFNKNLTVNNK